MDENFSRGYIQLGSGLKSDRLSRRGELTGVGPPTDYCYCIYFALLLAGVGFLLPYNSFIIAVDYFQSKYPGTTIVFDMSLIYILVAFVAVIINNLLVETLSLNVRITFGYIISFCTLLFVAVFEIWFEMFDLAMGYFVNLLAVAVVAFGCTVQQSSFYGYTSMLPSRYVQAVMTGESAAGLLVSTNRVLTKALLDDEKFNTILFFCISIAIVVFCFMIHFALKNTEFVNFYVNSCITPSENDDMQKRIILEPTEDVGLVDMLDYGDTKGGKYGVLSLRTPPSSPKADSAFESEKITHHDGSDDNDPWRTSCESINAGVSSSNTTFRVQDVVIRMHGTAYSKHVQWWSGIKRGVRNRWVVTRLVWPYMLTICLAYFVTLSLFPGIESEIMSCRLGSWMPVILMAIFNLFDFIGKILASIPFKWTKKHLLILSTSRIFLIPLLAMCAAPRGKPIISKETWAMVFTLVLGITNGVFGSVPMILAPTLVPDEQKELTGNIMTLSYSIGLTTGSGVAYVINYFLGPPLLHPCSSPMISTTIHSDAIENATSFSNFTSTEPELMWNITLLPAHEFEANSTLF